MQTYILLHRKRSSTSLHGVTQSVILAGALFFLPLVFNIPRAFATTGTAHINVAPVQLQLTQQVSGSWDSGISSGSSFLSFWGAPPTIGTWVWAPPNGHMDYPYQIKVNSINPGTGASADNFDIKESSTITTILTYANNTYTSSYELRSGAQYRSLGISNSTNGAPDNPIYYTWDGPGPSKSYIENIVNTSTNGLQSVTKVFSITQTPMYKANGNWVEDGGSETLEVQIKYDATSGWTSPQGVAQ